MRSEKTCCSLKQKYLTQSMLFIAFITDLVQEERRVNPMVVEEARDNEKINNYY